MFNPLSVPDFFLLMTFLKEIIPFLRVMPMRLKRTGQKVRDNESIMDYASSLGFTSAIYSGPVFYYACTLRNIHFL